MAGFSINEFKTIQSHWRAFIVSVAITSLFWFLCFFLFNRALITNYSFYIPIILCVSISIAWYSIMFLATASVITIFNPKTLKEEVSVPMYYGLGCSIFVLCLAIYINKVYIGYPLNKFTLILMRDMLVMEIFLFLLARLLQYFRKKRQLK
ncbi:MAG: hypothetical protein KFKLKKLM_02449 [Flavobacteriales bacterium]|nr:hypothetical protein [Flavobacteriales bacterium]